MSTVTEAKQVPAQRCRHSLPLSVFGFFDPGRAFAANAQTKRPHIVFPLLVGSAYSAVVGMIAALRIGLANLMGQAASRQGMDPQLVQQLAVSNRTQILATQTISAILGAFVMSLLAALLIYLILLMFGYAASYRPILATVAQVFAWVYLVRFTMILFVILISRDPSSIDIRNPIGTNLAFYVDLHAGWFASLMRQLDVTALAKVILVAFGTSYVVPKLSSAKACGIIVGAWIAYLLISLAIPSIA